MNHCVNSRTQTRIDNKMAWRKRISDPSENVISKSKMGFAELAAVDVSFKSEQEQPSHVVVPLQLLMSFPYRITEIDPPTLPKLASQNETQKLRKIKFEKINLKRNEKENVMYNAGIECERGRVILGLSDLYRRLEGGRQQSVATKPFLGVEKTTCPVLCIFL